jgi:hypothetical protein
VSAASRTKNAVGLAYGVVGLTGLQASADSIMLRSDTRWSALEDCYMANLVAGQIDHLWGVSLGLSRCKLRQCPVWPRGIEMVQ